MSTIPQAIRKLFHVLTFFTASQALILFHFVLNIISSIDGATFGAFTTVYFDFWIQLQKVEIVIAIKRTIKQPKFAIARHNRAMFGPSVF